MRKCNNPKCEQELSSLNLTKQLLSSPPVNVYTCPKCGTETKITVMDVAFDKNWLLFDLPTKTEKWAKVEGEESLPKNKCNIIVFNNKSGTQEASVFIPMPDEAFSTNWMLNHCSHYYIIEDIEKPKI